MNRIAVPGTVLQRLRCPACDAPLCAGEAGCGRRPTTIRGCTRRALGGLLPGRARRGPAPLVGGLCGMGVPLEVRVSFEPDGEPGAGGG